MSFPRDSDCWTRGLWLLVTSDLAVEKETIQGQGHEGLRENGVLVRAFKNESPRSQD